MLEHALFALIAGGAVVILLLRPRHGAASAAAACVAAGAAVALAVIEPPVPGAPPADRPLEIRDSRGASSGPYAASDRCRVCHPRQHATWSASYHRTMTQVAGPHSVLGDFDDLTLYFDGRSYDLRSAGGRYSVELSDPDAVDAVLGLVQAGDLEAARAEAARMARVTRRIAMTTGSHHYQLYWYPTGRKRELYLLPFAWMVRERRWVPRVSVFLTPPNQLEPRKVWNRDCLPCHATGGAPGYAAAGEGAPDTSLAEAGISCEACHGPGSPHVAANADPLRRYALHLGGGPDASIVQPGRLPAPRAAQICGQCHSLNTQYHFEDWASTLREVSPYRPGDDLAATTYVVLPRTLEASPLMRDFVRRQPGVLDEWFWPDGEIRVVGREYNGLLESPCYQGGAFGCLSCHAAHESDPADQLRRDLTEDGMCLQCHVSMADRAAEHTRHAPGSDGSGCQDCHMPRTTYGLLQASRSHRVTSPSVGAEAATERPNACNLCHLDRTLAWTADWLSEWYGQPVPRLDREQRALPAGAAWALRGDAGLRAIAAWHFGRAASAASGESDWLVPVLAPLANDPYDAVRYIALKALREFPGLAGLEVDFLDPPAARAAAVESIWEQWARTAPDIDPDRLGSALAPGGRLRRAAIAALYADRDERPVYLVE